MIRASFGRFGVDKKFKDNVLGCIAFNIPFGLYYYSYALSEKEAEEEVNHFVEVTKEYKEKMTFPACIDMEDSDKYKENHGITKKEDITAITIKACETLLKNEYKSMIYANAEWFKNKLDETKVKSYFKWLACWNDKEDEEKLKQKYVMWQYSSKGEIAGIEGKVDLNYSFVDFKKFMEYLENVTKIQSIKFFTGLNDLDMQFMSCYKWRSRFNK